MAVDSKMDKRFSLPWAVAFVTVWLVATGLLYANWKIKEEQYLDQHVEVAATAYRASVNSFALATELCVDETIRKPEVLSILAAGIDGEIVFHTTIEQDSGSAGVIIKPGFSEVFC